MINKYRKKPVEIEAIEWTGNNLRDVYLFMGETVDFQGDWRIQERFHDLEVYAKYHGFDIRTLEGTMTALVGDYIIKGVQGEFYPCKPDIFYKTYEEIEDRKGKVIDEELEEVAE